MRSQLQRVRAAVLSASVYSAVLLMAAILLLDLGHRFEMETSQPRVRATVTRGAGAAADNAESGLRARAIESYGKLPLSFEANQGQTDPQVRFLSRGSGYSLFLTGNEAVLALKKSGVRVHESGAPGFRPALRSLFAPRDTDGVALRAALLATGTEAKNSAVLRDKASVPDFESRDPAVLHMKLVGANARPKVTGMEELPGKSNYFIGNDPKKWRTNVPNYAKVEYENVYPGVDLLYYGNQGQLEYDFVVQPGADPRQIALDMATGVRIDGNGDLVVGTDGGEVIFHKPVVYQSRTNSGATNKQVIDGKYVLTSAHEVRLEVAAYDRSNSLVIDPTLAYSTYLGGSSGDVGNDIAVDASGNAYVTGVTFSSDFPTTPGAFKTSLAGNRNAFVSKLNAAGSALAYSTYLGGSSDDEGHGIAVDSSGNAYVTGLTISSDFPTTPGTFQTTLGGAEDAFISKLNAAGSALVYSTYLGGNGNDSGASIALDASGSAYVTGGTAPSCFPCPPDNFPTTPGALQTTFSTGDYNAFVSKLNAAGSALVYSTYLGRFDIGSSIAVDASGDAYVTGFTLSPKFPTTPGAFQTIYGGNALPDAFVSKLNATGSALLYSTYLGGPGAEFALGIAVDASGNAFVAGINQLSGFPTTPGAFQTTYGGARDAFISKLNAAGSALLYSTYLGGNGDDFSASIELDALDNAYVTGATSSTNFPSTPGAFKTSLAGNQNAFVSKLNAAGSALLYSTYLGGGSDGGSAIAVDAAGSVYVAGSTSSSGFPTTPGAFQTTYGGAEDAFISKFSFGDAVTLTPASLTFAAQGVGTYSPVQSATLKNTSGAALNIAHIYWPTGDYYSANNCPSTFAPNASCTLKVTFTPTSPGARAGAVTISDNAPGSPQKLSLSGTGSGTGSIILKLSPASLSFGSVAVGTTSSPQTVTVTNVGSVAANFSSPFTFATGGKDCGDFHKNPQCGTNLAPNASCEVTLTFQPKASGTRTGVFVVHQGAHTRSIPLGGTGTP